MELATRALVDLVVAQTDAPAVEVWMRTAAKKKPVALRSFVRTVLHELCHHLDFARDRLDHSFHTHGFFARESDLARQILGPSARPARARSQQPSQSGRPKFLDAKLRQPTLFDPD